MSHSTLTIVTITKDDRAGLSRTLWSAAGLRALGAQHIVIDGSEKSDNAGDLRAAYGEELAVHAIPPRGISNAFNFGLAEARGEWVLFLNGGDAVYEKLDGEWLLSYLATTRADIVTGAIWFDGEADARRMPHLSYQWPLIACWLSHPSTLVRRNLLVKVGGFDSRRRIAMDYDLWFRLLRPSVVVDVISVPFARFDTSGVSERREVRSLARREEARVVARHSLGIAWAGIKLGLRIVRRLAWSFSRCWH